jgi:protein tyrosine/serine phosphatase
MKTIIVTFLAIAFFVSGCDHEPISVNRPDYWAESIQLDGVPNLHKVSNDLYRSAQPTVEGMRNLRTLGIKTVVNLRSFHSDSTEVVNNGLGYEHIKTKTWDLEEAEIIKFLKIVKSSKKIPTLVHCQYGADRTGTMCAIYRIVVQNWTKEEAIKEMTQGGYGFHGIWDNLIQRINELDIDKIKVKAGIIGNPKPFKVPYEE